jgi:hypothetical protein
VHSLNHVVLAHTVAADRVRSVPRAVSGSRPDRPPPPVRRGAAYAVARVARRLDADVARRTVA